MSDKFIIVVVVVVVIINKFEKKILLLSKKNHQFYLKGLKIIKTWSDKFNIIINIIIFVNIVKFQKTNIIIFAKKNTDLI